MNLLILTLDTRGDVQPFVALPRGLANAGHEAVLALPIPMYVPTREVPWAGIAIPRWWPSALNRATFLGVKGPAMMFGRTVDRWREIGPAATPWPA